MTFARSALASLDGTAYATNVVARRDNSLYMPLLGLTLYWRCYVRVGGVFLGSYEWHKLLKAPTGPVDVRQDMVNKRHDLGIQRL